MSSAVVRTKLYEIDCHMRATHTDNFVDSEFPPSRSSLGDLDAGRSQHRQSRVAAIDWARAQDLDGRRSRQGLAWHVFNGDPRPGDVSQGMLGDCWLISALAVLAERPQLLKDIMISDELDPHGAYGVRLCKDGLWQAVIVDDYFPCSSGSLAFSEARRGALWVALIEKAYAKLHGSYAAIESGRITEALTTLTGAACETEPLQPDFDDGPAIDTELLWAKLVSDKGKGYLTGVSSLSDDGSPEADGAEARGIVTGHAYSLLQVYTLRSGERLVKLRNPWGSKEWRGRWSDEDAERNPAVAHMLQTECDHTPAADDGVFCIEYADLLRNFTRLEVCKVREGWHEHRKLLPMPRPTAAGQEFRALSVKGTMLSALYTHAGD